MAQRKGHGRHNVKKTVGLVFLGALCVVILVMSVRVAHLTRETLEEAATTPTAEPEGGNMLAVTPDPNAPTPEPVLKTGMQGDEVKNVQSRLQALGYYDGEIDGQFGSGTKEAVRLFQEQNGLSADGIVGSETRAVLFSAGAKTFTATPTPAETEPDVTGG